MSLNVVFRVRIQDWDNWREPDRSIDKAIVIKDFGGVTNMNKVVLVAFNGELVCFAHVLLNALDMKEKGFEVKIVIEGTACKLVPELEKEENPFKALYKKAKELNLFDGACKACSGQMKVLEQVEKAGLTLLGEMKGHPSLGSYVLNGFTVITF